MKKQLKYFWFKTTTGDEIVVLSNDFYQAEAKASKRYDILEYLGWTETL